MEKNDVINNAIENAATEAVAETVTDQIVNNPDFFQKHPRAGLVADGAALGAGVCLGACVLMGIGWVVGKAIDVVDNKVVQPIKQKHQAKKAKKVEGSDTAVETPVAE